MTKLSVIIPVYNEAEVITNCLDSLYKQTLADQMEVIVVDDGSTDSTKLKIKSPKFKELVFLEQQHEGPGAARNLGASKAKGEILVFVDADMEFAPDFLEKLIAPIGKNGVIGTFSKEEFLLNKDSALARCWNLNLGRQANRMHPDNYPNTQNVFRAILKAKFNEAQGFETTIGYTDDWSLSRKLKTLAVVAPGAIYFHANPHKWLEIWQQARWFGKNEFLTGSFVRKLYNLYRYLPFLSMIKGIYGAIKYQEPQFVAFKIVYDTGVFISVLFSFLGEQKAK